MIFFYQNSLIQFEGHSSGKAKFMLLDGTNFNLFDNMLDLGAPGGPKVDGIFSLAPGNEVIYM